MSPRILLCLSILVFGVCVSGLVADQSNSNSPVTNILNQLLEQANKIPAPTANNSGGPSNQPFLQFFVGLIQFMLRVVTQFMQLFNSFPAISQNNNQYQNFATAISTIINNGVVGGREEELNETKSNHIFDEISNIKDDISHDLHRRSTSESERISRNVIANKPIEDVADLTDIQSLLKDFFKSEKELID